MKGDVIAARDNGELLGTAAAVVGDWGGGRIVSREDDGLRATGDARMGWVVPGGRVSSSALVYRWDWAGAWTVEESVDVLGCWG